MIGGIFIGELSRRTGVSCEVLRAWERRYGLTTPERSAGGFRLYSAGDVARVRLMNHYLGKGLPAAQAAALVREAHEAARTEHQGIPPADVRRAVATLRTSLEGFDEGPAEATLERLLEVFTPCVVLTDVVLPYLHDLGSRWACDQATVAQEHFASRYLEARILQMGRGWGRGSGPRAVLACLPGEQHTLGLLACGIALRDAGWRVAYLGADTPVAATGQAAEAVGAETVVLAACAEDRVRASLDDLAALAATYEVALGGSGVDRALVADAGVLALPPDPLAAVQALTAARSVRRETREVLR